MFDKQQFFQKEPQNSFSESGTNVKRICSDRYGLC